MLGSFAVPPAGITEDADPFRQHISTTLSGLLGLLRIQGDLLKSKDHILSSNIVETAWTAGEDLYLVGLIRSIPSTPLKRIGVFDLEDFYPAAQRYKLAMMLNNFLAAPGFASWME